MFVCSVIMRIDAKSETMFTDEKKKQQLAK